MIQNVVSKFLGQLEHVSGSGADKSALMEMKSLVMSNDKQVLVQISKNCSLKPVFDCLNASDEEKVDLCCDVIYHVLKNMNLNDCLKSYDHLIQNSLCHPSPRIKVTFLNLLNDIVNDENLEKICNSYPAIMIEASQCIGSSDSAVARSAITFFTNMGATTRGLNYLYSPMIMEKFRGVMLLNDVARFRVYEIVSSVSKKSQQGLEASKSSGLLSLLFEEVNSSDTLLQLNALEILSSLGSCPHGYKYLQESGVIQYLTDKILRLDDESMSFILLPGLIEFFGNICREAPQDFISLHPEVIDLLFSSIDTSDEVLLGVIYSTVGKIGSTTKGKIVLSNKCEHMQHFFTKAGEILNRKNDAAVSVMHSLTELFTVKENPKEPIDDILLSWYNYIGVDPLATVVKLTKLPFIELRLSALTLLNAFAKQQWGGEQLCRYPGMIEYLTDRSTEFHKDCKSAKYDIVCSLIELPNSDKILSGDVLMKLRDFAREGPFYVPAMSPEMMTEGVS